MRKAWFWSVVGEPGEIDFPLRLYRDNGIVADFEGTLLSAARSKRCSKRAAPSLPKPSRGSRLAFPAACSASGLDDSTLEIDDEGAEQVGEAEAQPRTTRRAKPRISAERPALRAFLVRMPLPGTSG